MVDLAVSQIVSHLHQISAYLQRGQQHGSDRRTHRILLCIVRSRLFLRQSPSCVQVRPQEVHELLRRLRPLGVVQVVVDRDLILRHLSRLMDPSADHAADIVHVFSVFGCLRLLTVFFEVLRREQTGVVLEHQIPLLPLQLLHLLGLIIDLPLIRVGIRRDRRRGPGHTGPGTIYPFSDHLQPGLAGLLALGVIQRSLGSVDVCLHSRGLLLGLLTALQRRSPGVILRLLVGDGPVDRLGVLLLSGILSTNARHPAQPLGLLHSPLGGLIPLPFLLSLPAPAVLDVIIPKEGSVGRLSFLLILLVDPIVLLERVEYAHGPPHFLTRCSRPSPKWSFMIQISS